MYHFLSIIGMAQSNHDDMAYIQLPAISTDGIKIQTVLQ